MLPAPFHEHDGQIAIDVSGAQAVFTTAAWGDLRETHAEVGARLGVRLARVRPD